MASRGSSLRIAGNIEVLGEKVTTPEILGFFKSHKLNDGPLGKLKETLNTLNGLLDDAEEKQITKPAVQKWLNDARHAVYEAEDLMEVIEYEHLRSKDIKAASRRVRNRGDLRHIEGTGGRRPLSEKTTPLVNESNVYGREADKEAIRALVDATHHRWLKFMCGPYCGHGRDCMHDIISDLVEYVSGEFCFKLAAVRTFRSIHGVQHLRALFPLYIFGEDDSEALNDIWLNLKRLRRLSLCHLKDISSQLLNSTGNLKHLRHLDLSCTAVKRLPKSVCTLYYLQSLLLKECRHLMQLPSNLCNLVALQHLDIEGTNLKKMPPKMGKLTRLRTLQYYVVGKESGSSMKELGKLSHLRKKLSIRNLRDVANAQDALNANLKGKKKIKELRMIWDGNTDDKQQEREVLEKLEPSENVKQLAINGYGGTMFLGWLGNSFLNMVALTLSGCKNCISLPPLGQLPSLEELHIEGFDDVVAVGSEFYGSDPSMEKPFKSLKILKFEGMRNWQEWNTDVAGAFPHLAKLLIAGCPELTNGLPNHLPSLLILEIQACPQLVVSIPEAPLLTEINVKVTQTFIPSQRWNALSDEDCWQVLLARYAF
ncbi:hypothetical protein Peur_025982 [Populus x canadensis]